MKHLFVTITESDVGKKMVNAKEFKKLLESLVNICDNSDKAEILELTLQQMLDELGQDG